jgi:hypothetical protein
MTLFSSSYPQVICQGPVPRVPQGHRLQPNKSGYGLVPSSGKWLGNQVHHTRTDPSDWTCTRPLFLPWLNTHPGPRVASSRSLRSWLSDPEAGVLGRHGHLMPDKTRRNHWLPRAPSNMNLRAYIHAVAA